MTAAYATRALVCLTGRPGRLSRAREISESTGIPRQYLTKVLRMLAEKGFVATTRGCRGGYRLARAPGAITLLEIVNAIDGTESFRRCLLGLGKCSEQRGCPLHPLWSEQRRGIERRFRELSLSELARDERLDVERDFGFGCNGNPRPDPPAGTHT